MAADWDKLADYYAKDKHVMIADVDCTAAGKSLCDKNSVQGFPTIKYTDSTGQLQDYQQGRDYDSLLKFAKENLKPACSIVDRANCSEDDIKRIEKFEKLTIKEAEAFVADSKTKADKAEETFKTEVAKLQAAFEKLQSHKSTALDDIKKSGIGLLKAVLEQKRKKDTPDEL